MASAHASRREVGAEAGEMMQGIGVAMKAPTLESRGLPDVAGTEGAANPEMDANGHDLFVAS